MPPKLAGANFVLVAKTDAAVASLVVEVRIADVHLVVVCSDVIRLGALDCHETGASQLRCG
jgi:hypothetical protein